MHAGRDKIDYVGMADMWVSHVSKHMLGNWEHLHNILNTGKLMGVGYINILGFDFFCYSCLTSLLKEQPGMCSLWWCSLLRGQRGPCEHGSSLILTLVMSLPTSTLPHAPLPRIVCRYADQLGPPVATHIDWCSFGISMWMNEGL